MTIPSLIVQNNLFNRRYRPRIMSAKVVRAVKEATSDRKASFFKVGVRIDMEDGTWWFIGRSGSWILHFPIRQAVDKFFRPLCDRNGVPVMAPEMKNRWANINELKQELGSRNPWLLIKLWNAFVNAE